MNANQHVKHLRRAAVALRSPYLCNWDSGVADALATVFDRTAEALPTLQSLQRCGRITEPHLAHLADLMETVRLARTLLGSFGHTCGEQPAVPCRSCELTAATSDAEAAS